MKVFMIEIHFFLNQSLESIHKAVNDADNNSYSYAQTIFEQNCMLLNKIDILEERLLSMEMKINYMLDNKK